MLRRVALASLLLGLFFSSACSGLGLKAAGLNLGGGWMGQSYEYDGPQLLDPDRTFLWAGGPYLRLDLGSLEGWGIQLEALYFQKGFKKDDFKVYDEHGDEVGTATLEPEAHYISVPLLLRLDFTAGSLTPYLVAGPSLEILVSHDDFEVYDATGSATWGLHVGAGLESGRLGGSVRYVRDLQSSYEPVAGGTLDSVINDGIVAFVTLRLWP
ncbi:MAG: porin family protein [Candidatus Eisenbacteria bacterium]